MLQIAVHRGNIRREARLRPLDEGAGQPAPADAMDQTNARIGGSQSGNSLTRAIPAVVIDEHHLPGDAGERLVDGGDEGGDVVVLVEHGDDDAQFGRVGHGDHA